MKEINESYFTGKEKIKNIDECLRKNEKILWKGCPKRSSYALNGSLAMMPVALIWFLIDVSALIGIICSDNDFLYIIIPFFILHLGPFWIWIYRLIKAHLELKGIMYVITNMRVIVFKRNLGYIANSTELKHIIDLKLSRDGVDKLFRVGDIYIKGKETSFVLFDIPNSTFIFQKLYAIYENKENISDFYDNQIECSHCGSYYSKYYKRCPNCGAHEEKEK